MDKSSRDSWRSRAYNAYVSSGQSAAIFSNQFRIDDFPYFRFRVLPLLPADRASRILDLGCGNGSSIFCLKSVGYVNVAGVDVSAEQVSEAVRRGVREVQCGDLYEFLKLQSDAADVVMLMDVVEHMTREEVFRLFDAIFNVLKPGGLLVLHVPNAQGIFGMAIRYGDITHEISFSPQSIGQCLNVCGFEKTVVFEDSPVVHGTTSLVRRVLWVFLTLPLRLLYASESGQFPFALSKNMLVLSRRSLE